MKAFKLACFVWYFLQVALPVRAEQPPLVFCGSETNDLYRLLKDNGFAVSRFDTPAKAIATANPGTGVVITSRTYPGEGTVISDAVLASASKKKLRL